MNLQDLFLNCSCNYAFSDLLNYPNGERMQAFYTVVRKSLSTCFTGVYDAGIEIGNQSRTLWYHDFFNFKQYDISFHDACHAIIAAYEDHPLAYFVDPYHVYGNPSNGFALYALADEYKNGSVRKEVSSIVGSELSGIVSSVPSDISRTEKAKIVYDAMCTSATYDEKAGSANYVDIPAHSAAGFYCNRTAVCDGLSKAYQSVMLFLGIDCLTYSGIFQRPAGVNSFNSFMHTWNLVKLENKWHVVDLTVGVAGGCGFLVEDSHAQYRGLIDSERVTHAHVYQFRAPDFV